MTQAHPIRSTSTITTLRALMPDRPLSYPEALTVAELQANRLLELSSITEPPVPNLIITDLPRLDVEYRDNLPMSGYTEWSSGRWHIVLNRSESPLRQRFSLAHEFKHLLDHPYISRSYADIQSMRPEDVAERICDYFAACLLMPKVWVKSLYFHEGIQDVSILARELVVSQAALRYRLDQLGVVPNVPRHRPYRRELPHRSALLVGAAA